MAIKAAGIGLLLKGLDLLVDVFKSNQRVADAFAISMEFIQRVFSDLVNFILDKAIPVLTAVFKDPQQAVKDLARLIKENIIERFESLIDTLGYVGAAFKKLFSGDFAGAMEEASNAQKEFLDVMTGVNNTADRLQAGVKNLVSSVKDYVSETYEASKATIELRNNVRILTAQQQGLVAQYERDAEIQRQIRDDTTRNFEDRIKANTDLGKILEKQFEVERNIIEQKIAAAALDRQKDKNNIDAIVAEIEAKNELLELENRIIGQKSEQLINEVALNQEKNAAIAADDAYWAEQKKVLDEQIAANKKAADEKIIAYERAKQEAIVDTVNKGFASLALLADENAEASKGIAAAQATFSTYQAIAGQLAVYSQPGAPPIPGFAIAQAIATGAFGLLQVQKILNTNVNSPTASLSAGGSGGGNIPTAERPTQPTLPTLQGDLNFGGEGAPPIKVYVVATEINEEQALLDNINDKARI